METNAIGLKNIAFNKICEKADFMIVVIVFVLCTTSEKYLLLATQLILSMTYIKQIS